MILPNWLHHLPLVYCRLDPWTLAPLLVPQLLVWHLGHLTWCWPCGLSYVSGISWLILHIRMGQPDRRARAEAVPPAVDSSLEQQGPKAGPVRGTQDGGGRQGPEACIGPGDSEEVGVAKRPRDFGIPPYPKEIQPTLAVRAGGDGLGPQNPPSSQANVLGLCGHSHGPWASQRTYHWQAGSRGLDLPEPRP